ncbi:hypothetical protein COY20_03270 [Candidatus Shapirobacteria bacterium CG_4_10_14_0_2_um_filter_40_12]|uniref:Uncharacterized protein n=1 Tax=Candidatus Shapirobacteria bacterium CG_4_10_14_0_2_um_filter_40_12 TaxID=1974871 RepID=A0A2M7TSJ2_9BACT|nr:MAG: hypothetical protein COY20_03270 [Candidatus Shapirobacteria bacterium CG_4_10_14_0_2_um_filter_40_12]
MKRKIQLHFLPLLIVFSLASLIWLLSHVVYYNFIFLFLGLLVGSLILDIDHLIFWFYLRPNLEESRLALMAWKKGDFRSLLKLLESTHLNHTNLIFHHYFFQVVMVLISFFVFTSSKFIFAKAFLLAVNIHLLVDEFNDFFQNPRHLQDWLFARENKQLPLNSLKPYLIFFTLISLVFTYLLISSS